MTKEKAKAPAELSVEDKLRNLYTLQTMLSEIDKIKTLRGELPLEVEDLEIEIERLTTRIEKINGEIASLNKEIAERKGYMEVNKTNIERYKEQQNSVRNNREYDNLSKQIEYAELDNHPGNELIVSWQINNDTRLLRVYSLENFSGATLLEANAQDFTLADLDGDGLQELLALQYSKKGDSATVHYYSLEENGELTDNSAPLSQELASPTKMRTGTLEDGATALFVEGSGMDGISSVTDIFTWTDGKFRNITYRAAADGLTTRPCQVYAEDVDGDQRLEVPAAHVLPRPDGSDSAYFVFDWYNYSSDGSRRLSCSSYHCTADGWYLLLPDALRKNLTVRREESVSEERVMVLSTLQSDGTARDALTIYTITGENRNERSKLPGRFLLLETDTTIYAAALPENSELQQETVQNGFHLIYNEGNTGVNNA